MALVVFRQDAILLHVSRRDLSAAHVPVNKTAAEIAMIKNREKSVTVRLVAAIVVCGVDPATVILKLLFVAMVF
jgi:hypothetical protein